MSQLLHLILALLPLFLFVVVVIWMDAFSLTNWKRLAFCLLSGLLCYMIWWLIAHNMPEMAMKPYLTAILSEMLICLMYKSSIHKENLV